jgi:hypothetical protein
MRETAGKLDFFVARILKGVCAARQGEGRGKADGG